MTTMTIILQAAGQQGGMSFLIMMVAIFAIMYFFMIRPQQKKQKQLANFQNTVSVGTEVVTQGGIYGTVRKIDEVSNTLYIEIAKDVQIRVTRNAVYPAADAASTIAEQKK
ncbi:MAG: preprotein translocase subunit YajC [Bacteroidaceae bacterium]|nr:preprotein translocase subunit YajC [Bacteroidaceae bacterium]